MRLISTVTLELVTFARDPPAYAILSHTWAHDDVEEVNLQEMLVNPRSPSTLAKPGYKKIEQTCRIAQQLYSLNFCWVDTCCIDKTSSAELSEAINSMYTWYLNSAICFAYLCDMTDDFNTFCTSRWFSRGWTLQELIAPRELLFFDVNWSCRGTKESLKATVEKITGIPPRYLCTWNEDMDEAPVAARMAWAACERRRGKKTWHTRSWGS
ncbi:HET-domain-containing protein [Sporormia fimetaria CBS 119925]|uniref:HET-domain-containing protein n=1 Tax=Sporormia fimetaria CBS 119925 TaxID=1340428 RepID=A0A6A6UY14_9PLEO|nr:HET-domain-containing protein [Sporormia fimetaria CBS 119925]